MKFNDSLTRIATLHFLIIFIILSINSAGYTDGQNNGEVAYFNETINPVSMIKPLPAKKPLNPNFQVKYTSNREAMVAYEAINRALSFFKQNGYELETPIKIEFLKLVKVAIIKSETDTLKSKQVMAAYNSRTNCIKVTSLITDYCRNGNFFGVFSFDEELYTSIVTHEVAHCLFNDILDSRSETTDHAFSEFIAYITQIETMKEPHKTKVLSLWPEEKLPSIYAINSFIWMADPNKFGVMSYRFFKTKPAILRQILDSKIKPVEFGFILDY